MEKLCTLSSPKSFYPSWSLKCFFFLLGTFFVRCLVKHPLLKISVTYLVGLGEYLIQIKVAGRPIFPAPVMISARGYLDSRTSAASELDQLLSGMGY